MIILSCTKYPPISQQQYTVLPYHHYPNRPITPTPTSISCPSSQHSFIMSSQRSFSRPSAQRASSQRASAQSAKPVVSKCTVSPRIINHRGEDTPFWVISSPSGEWFVMRKHVKGLYPLTISGTMTLVDGKMLVCGAVLPQTNSGSKMFTREGFNAPPVWYCRQPNQVYDMTPQQSPPQEAEEEESGFRLRDEDFPSL